MLLDLRILIATALLFSAQACTTPLHALRQLAIPGRLFSEHLQETRKINIWLPPGYEQARGERFPVIYLLDGSLHEDYHHISGLIQFLTMYERMPRSIVVGIANVDRYRDFTHASDSVADKERLPTGGGSAAFLDFVEHELQPHVQSRFRTSQQRTLIGQSMGGLLATEALIDRPHLFDDYLIVSPSLWWGEGQLLQRAASALQANPLRDKRVFVTLGSEHPEMHALADELVATLKANAPEIPVGYETLRDETHATILHRGAYRAFGFFYGATHKGL